MECDVNDLLGDVNDLMDYETLERHDVESIIIDEIGYKENLATHEELIYQRDLIINKIKVIKEEIEHCKQYNRRLNIDVESLNISLNKINKDYKTNDETYFQFLVDEVIKSIVNKLEINDNV